jgi:hypothetical protein
VELETMGMPTYISMLKWTGARQPHSSEVRAQLELRSPFLRRRGMHSVAFLPDEDACAAVMVSTCADEDGPRDLANMIVPGATALVESMPFDDDGRSHVHVPRRSVPPPSRDYAGKLLEAIAAGV